MKIEEKIKELKGLATGSVFFPFTEPKVKSPITGKNVGGTKDSKEQVSKVLGRLLK